jgi:hypothetical protein
MARTQEQGVYLVVKLTSKACLLYVTEEATKAWVSRTLSSFQGKRSSINLGGYCQNGGVCINYVDRTQMVAMF